MNVRVSRVVAVVIVGLGLAVIGRTIAAGVGGGVGLLLGGILVLAGCARLYLSRR
jgi:hypothetical protein